MRHFLRFDRGVLGRGALFCGVALAVLVAQANAVELLGYYEFEGDFSNSSGPLAAASAVQNPGEVSFVPLGFRGQAVDINDPAANGGSNTGGSVNIPHNANPNESPEVTFGAWVNLDSNAGFPGFMAIDNSGWDRGLHLNGNSWGIASGGNSAGLGGAATVGEWQYVVGTFNKPANRATIYVGNANPADQTTISGTRADGGNNPGEVEIEIGRYDNQDLDALVDDAFVFDSELNAHQANAIRNLRLSSADLSVAAAADL